MKFNVFRVKNYYKETKKCKEEIKKGKEGIKGV